LSVGLGIGVGIFVIIGDLFESALKRSANMKDSGSFVPGRGGVLDSIDSLYFSVPFLLYFVVCSIFLGFKKITRKQCNLWL